MPASCRVISVIDDKFTLEFECEADNTKALIEELRSTEWGRRVATLLENMLPQIPETFTIHQAKTKFIEEFKDHIENGKIARVDMDEEDEEEILVVWINQPVELPREFCKFKIKEKKTPSYYEPPEEDEVVY